jgi:hypothetical protein
VSEAFGHFSDAKIIVGVFNRPRARSSERAASIWIEIISWDIS